MAEMTQNSVLNLDADIAAQYTATNKLQLARSRNVSDKDRKAVVDRSRTFLKSLRHLGELVGTVKEGVSAGEPARALLDRNRVLSLRGAKGEFLNWGMVEYGNLDKRSLESRLNRRYDESQLMRDLYRSEAYKFCEMVLIDTDPRIWTFTIARLRFQGLLGPKVPFNVTNLGDDQEGNNIYIYT